MRTQRHPVHARRRFAIVAATALALLATGGFSHAASTADEPPTNPFTFDTPDVPAGGTVTHTFKVNAPKAGRVWLYVEPGEGFRTWDYNTGASDFDVDQIDDGTNADCVYDYYLGRLRVLLCDVGAGESTIKYSLTTKAHTEAWKLEARARLYLPGDEGATEWWSNFAVISDKPVEMSYRVFGRDTAGGLYSHETYGVPDPPPLDKFERQEHGSGWDAFDAVTKLSPIGKDNRGGGVVAREPSGLLWYYPASGKKRDSDVFKPRVRVGTGWDTYNSVRGTGDVTKDGHADLIARDTSGVLWLYEGTGVESKPFAARTKVGSGWGVYNAMTGGVDSTNDGIADLYARDTSGVLWLYQGTGNAAQPYAQRRNLGSNWNQYTALIAPGDGSSIGKGSLLARDKTGKMWWYRGTGNPSVPLKPRASAVAETLPYNAWL
ncbi:hypothetical protein ACIHCQ_23955 [Streptomyces sp. NPDC052236]|uniref:hypothetical protein n=1 Tax=Streptomyces sp. NPDC052236 TaxID=3365686 RepID=UPI0037CF16B6